MAIKCIKRIFQIVVRENKSGCDGNILNYSHINNQTPFRQHKRQRDDLRRGQRPEKPAPQEHRHDAQLLHLPGHARCFYNGIPERRGFIRIFGEIERRARGGSIGLVYIQADRGCHLLLSLEEDCAQGSETREYHD